MAAGDFTPRAALETDDELGVLIQSFNRMTRQLDDARQQTERHRGEVEAARAYLESVLANLSAGVLAFDRDFVLRACNRGASAILDDAIDALEGQPLADWQGHLALKQAIREGFAGTGGQGGKAKEWQRQLDLERDDGVPQMLLLRGSTLPATGGGGYWVVFDDIPISSPRSCCRVGRSGAAAGA